MSGWILEFDGQPRLISARISHMLSVMRTERVAHLSPVVMPDDKASWAGRTEDGRVVMLRPVKGIGND
jgi:hypothetical protein